MNQIPGTVKENVVKILQQVTSAPLNLRHFSFLGGGSINHGGKLKTTAGEYFIKWNHAHRYPNMFETEALGLKLLKQSTAIQIPEVIGWFEASDFQGIVLQFIEARTKSSTYWESLGRHLAELHQHTNNEFGLDHNNYIGSLRQFNDRKKNWVDFFIHERLEIQLKLAMDAHLFDQEIMKRFQVLYSNLPALLPQEKPSLLHGDLWGGNVMTNNTGAPCLIDPAVYYGHREADLSFTKLFGGFDDRFYDAYQEANPLAPGFDDRVDIYNLYPLLVHVNLFGGGYVSQVKSILRKYL